MKRLIWLGFPLSAVPHSNHFLCSVNRRPSANVFNLISYQWKLCAGNGPRIHSNTRERQEGQFAEMKSHSYFVDSLLSLSIDWRQYLEFAECTQHERNQNLNPNCIKIPNSYRKVFFSGEIYSSMGKNERGSSKSKLKCMNIYDASEGRGEGEGKMLCLMCSYREFGLQRSEIAFRDEWKNLLSETSLTPTLQTTISVGKVRKSISHVGHSLFIANEIE